eukprot:7976108-Alexandrium_andersonii.AAC.1
MPPPPACRPFRAQSASHTQHFGARAPEPEPSNELTPLGTPFEVCMQVARTPPSGQVPHQKRARAPVHPDLTAHSAPPAPTAGHDAPTGNHSVLKSVFDQALHPPPPQQAT